MNRCENCIHYEVCCKCDMYGDCADNCKSFKDKSLCVELPYKVGQVVYVIRSQTSNGKNLYMREERIDHYRVFYNVVFMCFESVRTSVANDRWKTTVFLNKEDAQRKLKEIEGK